MSWLDVCELRPMNGFGRTRMYCAAIDRSEPLDLAMSFEHKQSASIQKTFCFTSSLDSGSHQLAGNFTVVSGLP